MFVVWDTKISAGLKHRSNIVSSWFVLAVYGLLPAVCRDLVHILNYVHSRIVRFVSVFHLTITTSLRANIPRKRQPGGVLQRTPLLRPWCHTPSSFGNWNWLFRGWERGFWRDGAAKRGTCYPEAGVAFRKITLTSSSDPDRCECLEYVEMNTFMNRQFDE